MNKKAKKVFVTIFEVLYFALLFFALFLCVIKINSVIQNTRPNFCGHTVLNVATPSMSAETINIAGQEYSSGISAGTTIAVRSVNTSTLNVGDIIAFYVYPDSFKYFDQNKTTLDTEIKETQFASMEFVNLFGLTTNKDILSASKSNSTLVLHHIAQIYCDTKGNRWFITQGSANDEMDNWYISEKYVVGIYSPNSFSTALSTTIGLVNKHFTEFLIIFLLLIAIAIINLIEEKKRNKKELTNI